MAADDLPDTADYSRGAIVVSAIVGFVVAVLLVSWASRNAVFYEELFRVGPTVSGGGIGTDWIAGNTIPALDFLIALTHAADVIMGVFILLMLFVHWAAFRRLAARMRQPGEGADEAVAADGGEER